MENNIPTLYILELDSSVVKNVNNFMPFWERLQNTRPFSKLFI